MKRSNPSSGFSTNIDAVPVRTWAQKPFVPPTAIISDQRENYHNSGSFEDDDDDRHGCDTPDATVAALDVEPEYFNPRPLKSRRLETEALGEPGERSTCFGCVYFGEKETTINSQAIQHLVEMSNQSFGRIDMVSLVRGMAEYYEYNIRQKINRNLKPGERPLPPWPAAQILEHLRYHNQDPLVQQVVLLAEVQEIRTDLLDCCFEVSTKTGRVRINKHAIDSYDKMVKCQLHIQKQDASKMAFYAAGARIKPEILNQGIMSTQTKKLVSYWGAK